MDTYENYQNGLLKVLVIYEGYPEPGVTLYQIQDKEQVISPDNKTKM